MDFERLLSLGVIACYSLGALGIFNIGNFGFGQIVLLVEIADFFVKHCKVFLCFLAFAV